MLTGVHAKERSRRTGRSRVVDMDEGKVTSVSFKTWNEKRKTKERAELATQTSVTKTKVKVLKSKSQYKFISRTAR